MKINPIAAVVLIFVACGSAYAILETESTKATTVPPRDVYSSCLKCHTPVELDKLKRNKQTEGVGSFEAHAAKYATRSPAESPRVTVSPVPSQ